ncbi:alanine--tRNA ligase-related protein [Natrialbaceae archaeon A-arb3/5]
MSGQRAPAEPYTTRFETEVTAVDGRQVWLDRSYFYGESGGQPSDRGTISDTEVADVQLVDGEPVHVLAEAPSFTAGRRVLCSVDWAFRMYCMRAHTAGHALYGAARRLLPEVEYGGLDIAEDVVHLDLETTAAVDDAVLVELNELGNRVVWESRPVTWDDVPIADARERDKITFDEATAGDAVEKGRVRIVTIGSEDDNGGPSPTPVGTEQRWDVAACSGTHVRNTREIGPVTVLGRSSPAEGVTRIEFAVGPRAIERRTAEKRAVFETRRLLETTVDEVPSALDRLVDEG